MISVSAGADVYAPSLVYLISIFGGALAVYAGRLHREEAADRRRRRGGGRARRLRILRARSPSGLFAAGYPTGLNNVNSSLGGQLIGMMTFLPLGFFGGTSRPGSCKKVNLLRVPPEVELEGLDMAEFGPDFYPEFAPFRRDDHLPGRDGSRRCARS